LIRIRLQKKGRKKRPIFHLVVADSKVARDGRIIEQVGRYDNVTEKKEIVLNEDRILYWLDTGAQPSDTVRKILRNEGILYKRHLMMWGKSEEEIEAAMTEWKAYRDSKEDIVTSRKDKHKNLLAAEEQEFKDQVQKKAAKAAVELETETANEEAEEAKTEEVEATTETEVAEETSTEETTEEAAPEEEKAPEVEAKEEVAEEAEVEEAPAKEEVAEEAEVEEAPAKEEAVEETTDETPAKEEETKEPAEEPKAAAESSVTSNDMTAKESIDHIRDNDLDALKGFISDDESRKTVLAAWESKQSEG